MYVRIDHFLTLNRLPTAPALSGDAMLDTNDTMILVHILIFPAENGPVQSNICKD